MASIRTVNMLWEKKIRGAYPASRYALDDAGTLTLALPRPLEARAYDLTRLTTNGGTEIRASFSVETLLKLEVGAETDDGIGMTSDDLYLFHGGKSRFLAERQILYIDAALSADGRYLATGFSDKAGASFALAYGEIGGRVAWLRESDVPIAAVAISRDGQHLALGTENGTLWLVDKARRDVWEFAQEEPIRTLACSADGMAVAYGTVSGGVGLINGEGARQWEARLNGEVIALALSGDGSLCAALVRPQGETEIGALLYCLVGSGQVGWEYEAEKRLVGLALSPDGRYMATSGRDGTQNVYEIVLGEGAAADFINLNDARIRAADAVHRGDLAGAVQLLREALDAAPAGVAVCEDLLQYRGRWFAEALAEAQGRYAAEAYREAIALLAPILQEEPLQPEAAALLMQARQKRSEQLVTEARTQETVGDYAAAEILIREAVGVAPLAYLEARRELANLNARRAAAEDAEAQRLLEQGQMEAAVAALERAQAVAASAERAAKIAQAQTAGEFAEGMAAYNEKRYSEAVFQFKKVLARDPSHSEAKRYLGFAQKFAQDAANDLLGDRFSRLE
ncbi:MAG TPA: hypothetical protein VKU00_12470 [Chthonomonadaceae bacterium]|nr:hypothetical protein [Chthonomonadaceae bacterium]